MGGGSREDRARLRGAAEEALEVLERLEAQLAKFKYESKVYGINDRAVSLMEDARVDCALIHGGTSTVYGFDSPPGKGGWRLALRDPRGGEQAPVGELWLCNRALSHSVPHNQAFRSGDRLYGHVLDPRAGEPTQRALPTAVGHASATFNDALPTALQVLGSEALTTLAARFPNADFLVLEETPEGHWFHSAGLHHRRLRLDTPEER